MLKKLYWLLRIYSIRAAQALINALLLFVPAISRAGRIRLEGLSVDIRILHGKAAHHFVVLVVEDMAMVNVAWKLAKLVTGNMEEVACLSVLLSEIRFGPSETVLKRLELINKCSIFPSGIVRIL